MLAYWPIIGEFKVFDPIFSRMELSLFARMVSGPLVSSGRLTYSIEFVRELTPTTREGEVGFDLCLNIGSCR